MNRLLRLLSTDRRATALASRLSGAPAMRLARFPTRPSTPAVCIASHAPSEVVRVFVAARGSRSRRPRRPGRRRRARRPRPAAPPHDVRVFAFFQRPGRRRRANSTGNDGRSSHGRRRRPSATARGRHREVRRRFPRVPRPGAPERPYRPVGQRSGHGQVRRVPVGGSR